MFWFIEVSNGTPVQQYQGSHMAKRSISSAAGRSTGKKNIQTRNGKSSVIRAPDALYGVKPSQPLGRGCWAEI